MNIENLIRDNIKALKPYSSARDEYNSVTKAMVFLDANENPFNNGVNRYPDPHQIKVKDLLCKIKGVSSKNILLGNGSDEVLDLIFRALCEPKEDNVVTLPPTYGMYEVLANTNAVDVIKVELTRDFQPNYEAVIEAANSKSKILFLCSPNNPTANSFDSNKVEKLLMNFKGIVVIDEAYIDFSNEASWISRLNEFPNLIVTQTLSKAYGLAGIRLGICYSSELIIDTLKKIKPPYNINELTQQRAIKRMSYISGVKNEIKIVKEERERLVSELETIDLIKKIYPSDANFLLVKVDDANKRYNQLIQKGIVVRNRTNQPLCENCLRFTVGTSIENNKLIKELKTL
ncbi:histidinol-phosphate transaminase [uncultured Lacinutrix sp.]|uniref:histidinol-phosphate transaminase n=1 Tax=uncultured Lacinutrix sp. TaxID=574032 RepID=UPI0026079B7F|nr:histidinol-phosphate transaminase [uncultured Lacinutrix sp.]